MISSVPGARLGAWKVRIRSLVGLVYIFHGQDGQIAVVPLVAQRNSRALLNANLLDRVRGKIQGDGHAEESAVGQAILLNNAVIAQVRRIRYFRYLECSLYIPLIIGLVHEA